ncbi:MAG TPA: helix-turn-helix transcriptional regulator [Rhizomicrobium sp.]|nr:helix-turn-helix transcriptional regulator [Rhizomicrobium sp.]
MAGAEIRLFASKNLPVSWVPQTFAEYLLHRRQIERLTQTQAAKRIGVALTAVNQWERGKRVPKRRLWRKVAAFLNIDEKALACLPGIAAADKNAIPSPRGRKTRAVDAPAVIRSPA